jgi:uncharacterized membrane protein HdeD (DUF308 family)
LPDQARKLVIRAAGILIILIAFAAVLLPVAEHMHPRRVIGWMLVAAGVLEIAAAGLRWAHRPTAAIAGAATLAAGLRLLLDETANFFEVLNLVILWLVVRTAAFGFSAFLARDRIGAWFGLAAAVDFLLAVALLAGLPIAILVVGLFGPTRQISATFAWVIAVSFIANGALLLGTAKLEPRRATRAEEPASAG